MMGPPQRMRTPMGPANRMAQPQIVSNPVVRNWNPMARMASPMVAPMRAPRVAPPAVRPRAVMGPPAIRPAAVRPVASVAYKPMTQAGRTTLLPSPKAVADSVEGPKEEVDENADLRPPGTDPVAPSGVVATAAAAPVIKKEVETVKDRVASMPEIKNEPGKNITISLCPL